MKSESGSGSRSSSGFRGGEVPSASELGLPDSPVCPFCDGRETELHTPFGSALSVATYWCRDCHTAFEWIKWTERPESSEDRS